MIKKTLIGLFTILIIALAGFSIALVNSEGADIEFNLGEEFSYAKLNDIPKNQFKRKRGYIPLKDGNKIAITYFLPKKYKDSKFPVILQATPYTASMVVPEMKWYERAFTKWGFGKWGPVFDRVAPKLFSTLTHLNYAYAIIDFRGTGSSTGFAAPNDPQYISDFNEIFDWIVEQEWSNGDIGMMGQSYLGWAQFAAAETKHPALKCIAPSMIAFDLFTENVRPGGIFAQKWLTEYGEGFQNMHRNIWAPDDKMPSFPSEPIEDLDGDGETYDEVPILNQKLDFASETKFQYADGVSRTENPYLELTKDHQKNIPVIDLSKKVFYLDDSIQVYDEKLSFENNNIAAFLPSLMETQIPVLIIGGFFDYFEGMPQVFVNLKNTNPAHLLMAPRFHIPQDISIEYRTLFEYESSYSDEAIAHQIRFFDHYLKGEENGFSKEEPVKIYTAFKGWENYAAWPPANFESQKFYLNNLGILSTEKTLDSTTLDYAVDYTHSSVYNSRNGNPNLAHIPMDSIMYRDELDKKCLVFETEVLEEEMTLTGYPIINLHMSADQENVDVYVYLSDVSPEGRVYYITEAQLRAGWHELHPNDELVNEEYNVKPELPWHSYRKSDYDERPFAEGVFQTLRFNLKPHAWKFKKGHKIRISIAGADKDNFEFNPTISPDNTLESCKPTTFFITTGGENESFIELPFEVN